MKLLFVGNVSIQQIAPTSVKPGSDFTIELLVNKGDMSNFAKLQQELPEGFTATAINSAGASFTFDKQIVKFLWTNLPTEQQFKISYKISVASTVLGTKTVGGKFSYVAENEKFNVDISPISINVTNDDPQDTTQPEVTTTETKTSDSSAQQTQTATTSATEVVESGTKNAPATTVTEVNIDKKNDENHITFKQIIDTVYKKGNENPNITYIRTVPGDTVKGSEFIVEILLKKDDLKGFAKLQENIPDGLSVTPIETGGASFTFIDQKAKFVWIAIPQEPSEIKLSYKVSLNNSIIGTKKIYGQFSYIENNETQKSSVGPDAIVLNAKNVQAKPVESSSTTKVDSASANNNNNSSNTNNTNSNSNRSEENKNLEKEMSVTNVPSQQKGIVYKVQVAALQNAKTAQQLQSALKLNETVTTEMQQGFTKYTVGNFSEYKQAKEYRDNLMSKGIVGPFVAAYNNGTRITVQEALMITNQKWYK